MRTEALFRALADPTRLRIMRLLGSMELAVGEIAQVLGQSQPRVSRHVGILCDAGLAERRREGSWIFLRAQTDGQGAVPLRSDVARLLTRAGSADPAFGEQCESDRRKLAEIRDAREEQAHDAQPRRIAEGTEESFGSHFSRTYKDIFISVNGLGKSNP